MSANLAFFRLNVKFISTNHLFLTDGTAMDADHSNILTLYTNYVKSIDYVLNHPLSRLS